MKGLLLVACVLAIAAPAQAQVILYGTATGCEDCFEESALFTIDPLTGEATLVGLTGFDNVTGLADVNGRLLATARGDDLFESSKYAILIEINRATGAGTFIGVVDNNETGNCGRMPGLTFDAANQILYAYSAKCNSGEGLYTIDPVTGAGTLIGLTGFLGSGNGLAIEPATGTLFSTASDGECLHVIDPNTGTGGTCIEGSVDKVPSTVNALAFDPLSGVLFGSHKESSERYNLVVIDTADVTTTIIGETVLGLDGIVFFEVAGSSSSSTGPFGGCVVATAAYGTPMANDINVLRQVRDTYLLNTAAGTAFVEAYYTFSPPLADFVAKHPAAATTVRVLLTPVIAIAGALWTLPLMAGAFIITTGYALRRRKLSQVNG